MTPAPLAAPPAHALQTLAHLREETARRAATNGAELAARTLLATIVARYDHPEPWERIEAEVRPVALAYPCRVIALVNDPAAAANGRVLVGLIESRRPDGGADIRGELLVAALHGRAFDEGAAIAAGWASSGIPTIVWWNGPAPQADHLFDDTIDVADRVVVDSAAMTDPAAQFAVLRRQLGRRHHARMTDALWVRLTAWRQAVAQMFDPPTAQADLARVTRVRLEVDATPTGQAAALYMLGWLSSRLDWRLHAAAPPESSPPAPRRWRLAARDHARQDENDDPAPPAHAAGRTIQAEIALRPAAPHLIHTVELAHPDGRYGAHWLAPEDIIVEVERRERLHVRNAVRCPPATRHRVWLDELTQADTHYRVFDQAVTHAAALAAA